MHRDTLKSATARPSVVIASLTVLAVLAFLGVGRLVNRFQEQQKALARHLYQQGLEEQQAGKPELALVHFRDALTYDRDNFQYQLSLARALRDSGRTSEAETYLISLWQRSPQSGAVNLALGRLAARQQLLDKTTQYYHNAIYGVWTSNPDENRLNAWFELIDFLVRRNARPQAQSELITLAAELPHRAQLQLRVADLFAQIQDNEHALDEYRRVLQVERADPYALAGAGQAAFNLARYRTAARYLDAASKANPQSVQLAQMLAICNLVLQDDPFARGISMEERNRRTRRMFEAAGRRLETCGDTAKVQADVLAAAKAKWLTMKPKLVRLGRTQESGLPDEVMDLVLQIEEKTAGCEASEQDQALFLLAQNRAGVEQ